MEKKIFFPSLKDIQTIRKKYPQLHYQFTENSWKFIGNIDILDNNKAYYDGYDIEIVGTEVFPNSFPKLFEKGGKFPKTADWHTFIDESCCTAVKPKEILSCRNGISVTRYIEEFVIPYLANQTYKRRNGKYTNGEYEHNELGEFEFFQELFFTKSLSNIFMCLQLSLSDNDNSGNKQCLCNSGKKYKICHKKAIDKSRLLGKMYLMKIKQQMQNYLASVNW